MNKIYYKENTGMIGVPRLGSLKLDYFVIYIIDINPSYPDDLGNMIESNISNIYIRFHSSEEIAGSNPQGYHARIFTYPGIDKNEEELIKWVLNTPNIIANGSRIYNIYQPQIV